MVSVLTGSFCKLHYPDDSFHMLVPLGPPEWFAVLSIQKTLCPTAYKAGLEFWRKEEGRSTIKYDFKETKEVS